MVTPNELARVRVVEEGEPKNQLELWFPHDCPKGADEAYCFLEPVCICASSTHTHTITLPHAYVRAARVDPQANAHSPAHPTHARMRPLARTHAGILIPFPGELKRPTESASGYDLSFSQKVNAVLEPDPKAAAPYCNDYAGRSFTFDTFSRLHTGLPSR